MISPALVAIVQCPDCGAAIMRAADQARCEGCGRVFETAAGYLDLRPATAFAEQTKYLDAALHADARHETVAPPLLGSKIRNDMLRRFLQLGPTDRVLDLGCGSGRTLVWNADTGAALAGVDISAFFSREALDRADLLLGDLRRLPVRDAAFTKAWSLDVLEHLSRQALTEMLTEAHRVLAPGGALFVYTHVRKNGWIAGGVRLVNGFAHACERMGLLSLRQERLRKSDHLNPIADHDDLERIVEACGFRLERVTYYTPIIGAFVENVLMRIGERVLQRRAAARLGGSTDSGRTASADPVREARKAGKALASSGGAVSLVLRGLTVLMHVDVALFGRLQSGPFFALLRKPATSSRPPAGRET